MVVEFDPLRGGWFPEPEGARYTAELDEPDEYTLSIFANTWTYVKPDHPTGPINPRTPLGPSGPCNP